MKRTFCLLLCCLVFLLSACGVSQTDYDALVEENSSLQTQVISLQSEVETLKSELESSQEVTSEFEESKPESTTITSGEFYDSVSAIHSDVVLTEIENGISISLFFKHENELEDSIMFFDVVSTILEESNLENYYSNVTFMMFVDDSLVTMLTLLDYSSSSSFVSTGPIILKNEYKESIETLYSLGFSSNDVSNNFDETLDELREEYNLSN